MLKKGIRVDGNKGCFFSEEEMRAQIESLRKTLLSEGDNDRLREFITSLNLIGASRFYARNLLRNVGCRSLSDESGFDFLLKEVGIIWDINMEKKSSEKK